MVFLDASDIQTTRPSQKLSHCRLGPFPINSQVGNGAYRLCLPLSMSRLHPVFNVVKLSLAPPDPIPGWRTSPPPLLEIVDGKEEWVVEEILDSWMVNRKLCYLVDFRSIPFRSVLGRHCLEGGWMLGDAPRPLMFPPILLRHLCIFLLIVASPRQSALAAPIPESDDHVM